MIAYKFLRAGRIGAFSRFAWPEGEWVEARPDPCLSGIHACEPRDLPYWVDVELWEIELADAKRCDHKLVAPRGRLVRQVGAWDAQAQRSFAAWCVDRGRDMAARDAAVAQHAEDLEVYASMGAAAVTGFIAVRAAEIVGGEQAYVAERALQAEWFAALLASP